MSITNDWRELLAQFQENGEALEALAKRLPEDIPWRVEADSWAPTITWGVLDETPQAFAGRVRKVQACLKTEPHIYPETYGDTPSLYARWKITVGDMVCHVRLVAEGSKCRMDPRTKYEPMVLPKPHPECKAMLEELREEVTEIREGAVA